MDKSPSRRKILLTTSTLCVAALAGCTDDPLEQASGIVVKNLHTDSHTVQVSLQVDEKQQFADSVTVSSEDAEKIEQTIPGPRFLGKADYSVTAQLDNEEPISAEKTRNASFDFIGVTIGPELDVGINFVDAR